MIIWLLRRFSYVRRLERHAQAMEEFIDCVQAREEKDADTLLKARLFDEMCPPLRAPHNTHMPFGVN